MLLLNVGNELNKHGLSHLPTARTEGKERNLIFWVQIRKYNVKMFLNFQKIRRKNIIPLRKDMIFVGLGLKNLGCFGLIVLESEGILFYPKRKRKENLFIHVSIF